MLKSFKNKSEIFLYVLKKKPFIQVIETSNILVHVVK